jgi:hypothetical protein
LDGAGNLQARSQANEHQANEHQANEHQANEHQADGNQALVLRPEINGNVAVDHDLELDDNIGNR